MRSEDVNIGETFSYYPIKKCCIKKGNECKKDLDLCCNGNECLKDGEEFKCMEPPPCECVKETEECSDEDEKFCCEGLLCKGCVNCAAAALHVCVACCLLSSA
jgi:hypothetical protein